jgi:hypothetical protein
MKSKGKPKFGIMVAVTTSPVGKAYKKAEKQMAGKKSKAPSVKKMNKEEAMEQRGYKGTGGK